MLICALPPTTGGWGQVQAEDGKRKPYMPPYLLKKNGDGGLLNLKTAITLVAGIAVGFVLAKAANARR